MKIRNVNGEIAFRSSVSNIGMAIREMIDSMKENGHTSTRFISIVGESIRSLNIECFGLHNLELRSCLLATSRPMYIDLSCSEITDCRLESVNLSTCKLEGAIIDKCKIIRSNFGNLYGSRLDSSEFTNCSFSAANLSSSEVIDCKFSKGTNFSHSDLRDCKITGVLDTCDLSYADLRGADLSELQLTCCDLSDAKIDSTTKFKVDPIKSGCKVENTMLMDKTIHVHVERVNKIL